MKKQTALRLAQEQSSVVVVGSDAGMRIPPPEPQRLNHPSSEESIASYSFHTTSTTLSDIGAEDVTSTTVTTESPSAPSSAPVASTGHRLFRSSSMSKQQRAAAAAAAAVAVPPENLPISEKKFITPTKSSGGFFFSRGTPTAPSSAPTMKPHPTPSRSLFFTSTSSGRNHTMNTASTMNSNLNVSSDVIASHTAIDTSTATEKGANAKLPHGLTVSELKQMTKARLQAEATHSHHDGSSIMTMMDSTHGVANDHHHHLPSYMGTMDPSMTTMAAPTPPTRRSPFPMIYDTTSDTWETASVSTTCTSEFLFPTGSAVNNTNNNIESMEPNSFNEDSSIPFVRALSYPNNSPHPNQQQPFVPAGTMNHQNSHHHYGGATTTNMYHHPPPPLSINGSHPYHATANRCRAATSSPRLGMSSTSAVYHANFNAGEDFPYHPHHPGYPMPVMHNNTNSMSVNEALPFPDEYMTSNTIFPDQAGANDGSFYPSGLGHTPYSFDSNRCRTSSLPSVMLPTVEDDEPTRNNNDKNFGSSLRHPVNQLSAVSEQATLDKSNIFVAGLSETFQSPQVSSSFPSFYSANSGNINDAFTLDDGFGMTAGIGRNDPLPQVRYRASTWADATSTTSNQNSTTASSLLLFGNVGSSTATAHGRSDTCTTDISDDLASILKLSTTSSLSSQLLDDNHNIISTATNTTTDRLSNKLF